MGELEVVNVLLDAGSDADRGKRDGAVPLHIAARRGQTAVVAALLARGAQPDPAMSGGTTPLHIAASKGEARVVETLLQGGASAALEDEQGRTAFALMRASRRCTPGLLRALRPAPSLRALGNASATAPPSLPAARRITGGGGGALQGVEPEPLAAAQRRLAPDGAAPVSSAELSALRAESDQQAATIAQLHDVIALLHDQASALPAANARADAAEARLEVRYSSFL